MEKLGPRTTTGYGTLKKNVAAFAEKILTELQKRNIDFTLCRGQAYSGLRVAFKLK